MNRLEATELLVSIVGDSPIIASLGHPAYDLCTAGDRPGNFYTWGSMGLASSIGLGLAIGRPDLRVFVLDGDGSLLMNLGSLATIATTKAANLVVIVWDNGEYGTTGGQPTPTAAGADLAEAARALGVVDSVLVRTDRELREAVAHSAHTGGPSVVVMKVTESRPTGKPPLDCVFIKQRFMAAMGRPERATSASTGSAGL
jgi:thiamine pyrophosphate-dependent acetolactate synthase large subunit-like protein